MTSVLRRFLPMLREYNVLTRAPNVALLRSGGAHWLFPLITLDFLHERLPFAPHCPHHGRWQLDPRPMQFSMIGYTLFPCSRTFPSPSPETATPLPKALVLIFHAGVEIHLARLSEADRSLLPKYKSLPSCKTRYSPINWSHRYR